MNVLCFVMDDMDNEMYQYMPYLSGLPEGDWVRFSNSYQSNPLCGPSRANMLLGQRYTETGVEENSDCPTDMISRESDIVWTQLQADGAATAAVGKYTNSSQWGMKQVQTSHYVSYA